MLPGPGVDLATTAVGGFRSDIDFVRSTVHLPPGNSTSTACRYSRRSREVEAKIRQILLVRITLKF